MAAPLITVVIPTKGRADKLRYTLKTVLEQCSDRFEIVVSDNYSTDETQSWLSSIKDARIRYFRTDRRLSMCDNFEFALQQVRSDYVLFIGDDDGLMPECIDVLASLIETKPYQIYYWPQSVYIWGSGAEPPVVHYVATPRQPRKIALRPLVERCFKLGGARYQALPLVYHSLVATDLLTSIRKRTGRVFHSMAPDVFCGFALPVFSETALDVGQSMTLTGSSEGGIYNISKPSDKFAETAARHEQFIKEYGQYRLHRSLDPALPHVFNVVPNSMLVAADLFPEYYAGITFNYEFWFAMIQRYWHFATVASIFRNSKPLTARHPFNPWKFLMYAFLYRAYGVLQAIRATRRVRGSFGALYNAPPANVYVCAKSIGQIYDTLRTEAPAVRASDCIQDVRGAK